VRGRRGGGGTSKSSRRPNREVPKAARAERRRQQEALRERQREQGLAPHPTPSLANTVAPYATLVLLYGLLSGVFQLGSRREVNRPPRFMDNLKRLFPILDSLQHADTLFRLLANIGVERIETLTIDLIERFIPTRRSSVTSSTTVTR
jgi:hypothetical protein